MNRVLLAFLLIFPFSLHAQSEPDTVVEPLVEEAVAEEILDPLGSELVEVNWLEELLEGGITIVWQDEGQSSWHLGEGYRRVRFKKGYNDLLVRIENGPIHCVWSVRLCPPETVEK